MLESDILVRPDIGKEFLRVKRSQIDEDSI